MLEDLARPDSPALPDLPSPSAVAAAAPVVGADLDSEQLAELWQRVMRDLNAQHKRAYALLRNADPLMVEGDALVLVAAYEFHHKQISQDAVRMVIEEAVAHAAGRHYRLVCVPDSEADGYRARLAARLASPPTAPPPVPTPAVDEPPAAAPEPSAADHNGASDSPPPTTTAAAAPTEADDQARVQAAINIFGARPVS
jgi:hypothetical protein